VVESAAQPTAELDRAARWAHVVGALADAACTLDRPTPVCVAIDALAPRAGETLADELAGALIARGRRCRRAALDAFGYLDPAGPAPNPAAHRTHHPRDDLAVIDGGFLQHAELVGAFDLVIFLRQDPPPPRRTPATPAVGRWTATWSRSTLRPPPTS
jgi:hypothetical protein